MIQVTGVEALYKKVEKLAKEHEGRSRLVLGYADEKALWVHENREMKLKGKPRPSGIGVYWGPHGRAGFLTDVATEMRKELSDFIVAQLKRGITLGTALYWAGRRLIKESQRNVPVEYGDLRDSAFVRVE